jgi:exopolyphosphatase/guanosine-5'-triphosphate,3'-diphosphate pyrophosphatase
VRSTLTIFEHDVDELGFDVAVASSGTAEAIARIVHAASGKADLKTFNCFHFTRGDLDHVVTLLSDARTVATRRRVPGLDPARADIILAGALILQGVAEVFSIRRFVISDYALREGVLLDTIQRHVGSSLHNLRDVPGRSVRQLAAKCDDDVRHSEHVAKLALQLFDATKLVHGLDDSAAATLEAGALLANVGLVISHSKHHLHSYYVIRNSELVGFTDPEIELIAQVARYHRKSAPKPTHPEFAALDAEDQHTVRVLAGLLRIAIALDRTHEQRVGSVSATVSKRAIEIEAVAADGADVSLELWTANERTALLAETLGRTVKVEELLPV